MRVSKKALDDAYRTGRGYAMRGIPPNPGRSEHPHDRYFAMAHRAGWHDGNVELKQLVARLKKRCEAPDM